MKYLAGMVIGSLITFIVMNGQMTAKIDDLTHLSIEFAGQTFIKGCTIQGNYEDCVKKSKDRKKEVKEIYQGIEEALKVYSKPPRQEDANWYIV